MGKVFIPADIDNQNIAMSFVNPNPLDYGSNIRDHTLMNYAIPRDRRQQIQKAKEYRKVDIIDRLLRIRVDFGLKVKDIVCKNPQQNEFYRKHVLPLLKRVAKKWIYEHSSLGDVFLHWGFKANKIPMYLIIEDPEDVDVKDALGQELYKVRFSSEFSEYVKELRSKRQLGKLPRHILKALRSDNDVLVLDKTHMFRTDNTKPDYETYSVPPLMRIAEAIELRRLLTEGDWVTAYGIKNEIIHCTAGEKDRPAQANRLKSLKNLVQSQPSGTMWLFTQHDVNIKRITPDASVWDTEKYKECNTRILQWGGITVTLIDGKGAGYASAIISTKSLVQSMKTDQEVFDNFVERFFGEIDKRNGFTDKAKIIYERNVLEEHNEFMERVKYLVGMGVYSIEDVCFLFGLDVEEQKLKKQNDKDLMELFVPWFEQNQGLLEGKQVGRPSNKEGVMRETDQPKPSS